ncbi:heavy-metal-associated domain-containing protein [Nafulsella turpanensis]|uniref:heavy-metal-associated domain-containing protein n=1 Tax=Nafulsella turpanensis TaxID=1265690 RepID=UPI000344FA0E|nr:heavy-metal-associated domain-containing protein [Nafulsella turpanensis]
MERLILLLVLAFFSSTTLFAQTAPQEKATAALAEPAEWVTLKVTGITCAGCAGQIQKALAKKEGVLDHQIKYPGDLVKVKVETKKIRGENIRQTIIALGYKAETVEARR